MTRHAALLCAVATLAFAASAGLSQDSPAPKEEPEPIKQAPRPLDPRAHRVGELIADVAFTDVEGKQGKLSDFQGKPLVVALTNTTCPICKKYAPTLAELHAELEKKDAAMLLVNPSAADSAEKIKEAIARCKFTSRYVHDAKGEFAAALGANSTGDCFLLDGARTLIYRGAVDDQYGLGYAVDAPRHNYLRDAVAALLAGGRSYTAATWAPGCEIEPGPAPRPGEITWHNRVSRIIQGNCQECHRKGEPGPFELATLEDVKAHVPTIQRVVRQGAMPPWTADPQTGHWHNDRSLSSRDKADLLAWIDGGMKPGDEKDAALPRQWPPGWRIGTPDATAQSAKHKVPARGIQPYVYSMAKTNFGEDKWVQAMEIRPSAPQAVHHVLIFLQYPADHPRAGEQPEDQFGVKGYFMGMVPGQGHIVFPPGQGKFVPKGASMFFQVHYTPNGEECEDQTTLGMIWCKERPRAEVHTRGIAQLRFRIPPGADNHEVQSSQRLEAPIRVLSLMPHMHLRGKAYRFGVEYADGRKETLLDVPRYDFNWQFVYILREPIDLPAGARIRCTGWFDNSDRNPANPDPKAEVRWGEQTWQEMQIGYVNYIKLE